MYAFVDNPKNTILSNSSNTIDYFNDLINSLTAWSIYNKELKRRSVSSQQTGSYASITYFSINIKTIYSSR